MTITDQIKFLDLERVKLINEAESAKLDAARQCFLDKADKYSQTVQTLEDVVDFFQHLDRLTIMANRKKA